MLNLHINGEYVKKLDKYNEMSIILEYSMEFLSMYSDVNAEE